MNKSESVVRNRKHRAPIISRKQAIDAINLFNEEWIGQDQEELWEWALSQQAVKKAHNTEATKTYRITPVPKPRQTQSDKWNRRPCVMRYRDFADEVTRQKINAPVCGANVTFVMPMPKSWSKKKKAHMEDMPHQQKPDIDNLLKALLDAIYEDDSVVWNICATKIWGYIGKIIIRSGGNNV